MGATKTDHFTDQQNELAILAKALGHPARIAIIEYILKVDTCICGDIVNELPLAQPTVSQHLKELKNAGMTDEQAYELTSQYLSTLNLGKMMGKFGKHHEHD